MVGEYSYVRDISTCHHGEYSYVRVNNCEYSYVRVNYGEYSYVILAHVTMVSIVM